jgi:oligopeptide transport system ATP-binding protein
MTALLEVRNLVKTFRVPSGIFGRRSVSAVADVSLDVHRGEVLGLVGESGSGKTTLARCLLGLTPVDDGSVTFDGVDVTRLRGSALADFRRRVQPVFQDPYASLDPRWPVGRSIREALDAYRIGTPAERDRRVLDLLDRVGLGATYAQRFPRELSGGQRQRVGIAAALASGPDLIIADEPVSALDVSVQAQVLNLVASLQRDLGVAVLFVAHDLAVVEHISQRVAVMYLGRLAEVGTTDDVFARPRHPYTRALIEAIPHPDPSRRGESTPLAGEIPSPLDPPGGCRFHPRCPLAVDACRTETPALSSVSTTHRAACLVTAPNHTATPQR